MATIPSSGECCVLTRLTRHLHNLDGARALSSTRQLSYYATPLIYGLLYIRSLSRFPSTTESDTYLKESASTMTTQLHLGAPIRTRPPWRFRRSGVLRAHRVYMIIGALVVVVRALRRLRQLGAASHAGSRRRANLAQTWRTSSQQGSQYDNSRPPSVVRTSGCSRPASFVGSWRAESVRSAALSVRSSASIKSAASVKSSSFTGKLFDILSSIARAHRGTPRSTPRPRPCLLAALRARVTFRGWAAAVYLFVYLFPPVSHAFSSVPFSFTPHIRPLLARCSFSPFFHTTSRVSPPSPPRPLHLLRAPLNLHRHPILPSRHVPRLAYRAHHGLPSLPTIVLFLSRPPCLHRFTPSLLPSIPLRPGPDSLIHPARYLVFHRHYIQIGSSLAVASRTPRPFIATPLVYIRFASSLPFS
ncbi:hypothetical protein C8J57DRAFT_1611330 [Mycena rebaudengoi]|nr:hypothetical protein C8J57DRAFT_1611330 [Mycena rebaudengoi]